MTARARLLDLAARVEALGNSGEILVIISDFIEKHGQHPIPKGKYSNMGQMFGAALRARAEEVTDEG